MLCYDKVRYVGDAVALVVAESEDAADSALGLIEVEYQPLPVVTGPKEAARDDSPKIHEKHEHGNFLAHFHLESGDLAKGFSQADVIVEREYRTQTVEHAFIEPEAALAMPESQWQAHRVLRRADSI